MNIFSFAVKGLGHKPLHTTLGVIAIAMAIAMLTAVFLISSGISDGLRKNSGGVDVVAGAKGSPLQLILSTIYHTDVPIGNIDIHDFEKIQKNPMVKKAIPIAVGDNFGGFRVVGTTPDYLGLYQAKVAEGTVFRKPFEVVAGALTTVKLGEEFAARHGFAADSDDVHDDHLYKVVGRLAPTGTVIDKLLLTSYQAVQESHHHHHEDDEDQQITAILIEAKNGAGLMNLPRMINQSETLQAANPAYELARLSKSFGLGRDVLNALGFSILTLSLLMLFSTLATSLTDRRRDMAVLRVLGASPFKLFAILIIEGVMVSGLGAIIGLIIGHGMAYSLTGILGSLQGVVDHAQFMTVQSIDLILLSVSVMAGILAALPAGISAARTDIALLLGKG
jgi:putative ABC transport system permease protein